MIPVAAYGFLIQTREGGVGQRKGYRQRTLESIGMMFVFGCLAFIVIYLKRHHHSLFGNINPKGLKNSTLFRNHRHGHRVAVEPQFEWTVFWIALAVVGIGGGWLFYKWRTRKLRTAVPLDQERTVAEDLAREVTLMETYDRAGDAIADWLAAGADTVHLVLPPGRPEDELAEVVKIAAASASTTSAD